MIFKSKSPPLESDNFAMSTMLLFRVIRNYVPTYSRGVPSYSEPDANTLEVRDVFENGAVAATFYVFELAKQWKFIAF